MTGKRCLGLNIRPLMQIFYIFITKPRLYKLKRVIYMKKKNKKNQNINLNSSKFDLYILTENDINYSSKNLSNTIKI